MTMAVFVAVFVAVTMAVFVTVTMAVFVMMTMAVFVMMLVAVMMLVGGVVMLFAQVDDIELYSIENSDHFSLDLEFKGRDGKEGELFS